MTKILLFIIKIYSYLLSPLMGKNCRYYPTCSDYAKQAIIKYGVFKGSLKTLGRLSRCHPWGGSGIDLP